MRVDSAEATNDRLAANAQGQPAVLDAGRDCPDFIGEEVTMHNASQKDCLCEGRCGAPSVAVASCQCEASNAWIYLLLGLLVWRAYVQK